VGGGLELAYRTGKSNDRSTVELFGYLDGGATRDRKSSLSAGATHRLASTGVGARFSLAGTTVAIETGVPLSSGRHPRLFVSIFRSF
jgi:hemolysin activation/secretion protein